jgi:hypothetical protein
LSSPLIFPHQHQTSSTSPNKSSSQAIQFPNLGKYKGASPNLKALFKDIQITTALRQLLKRDYQKLIDNLENVDIIEPLVNKDGILIVSGGVSGAYTIAEAIFIIEPRGHIYAAILDDGDRVLYFTNDTSLKDKLPPAIEEWRERFKEVAVVYRSK